DGGGRVLAFLPDSEGRQRRMSGASPEGVTPPEVWSLDHPDHGLLELAVGGPDQLRVLDNGFPRRRSEDAAGKVATPGYSVFRGGALVARAPQVGDHKVAITRKPPARGEFTTSLSAMSGPRAQMRSRMFATGVGQVAFRDRKSTRLNSSHDSISYAVF